MNQGDERLVLTIGYSTRPLDSFIDLLIANKAKAVVDIRTVPRSRNNPQFNEDVLPGHLKQAGIEYIHMAGLGGLRHPRLDSTNGAWRNASFRGFADYMQTGDFRESLNTLVSLAKSKLVTLMCAEAVPWRCHRSLIADALLVRGYRVEHIIGKGPRRPHALTPWAAVHGTAITYPAVA